MKLFDISRIVENNISYLSAFLLKFCFFGGGPLERVGVDTLPIHMRSSRGEVWRLWGAQQGGLARLGEGTLAPANNTSLIHQPSREIFNRLAGFIII
jgi:hypothetical protein